MRINRNNYESYFLSYIESNLPPEEVAELLVFLDQNPDLKEELESFEAFALRDDDPVFFKNKKFLKKRDYKSTENIHPWNYEEKMVALLEGDLSGKEAKELHEFMALNLKASLELKMFRKTFLSPEEINYPDKSQLKKAAVISLFPPALRYAATVAVLIGLLAGLFLILDRTKEKSPVLVEEINDVRVQDEVEKSDLITDQVTIAEEQTIETLFVEVKETTIESPLQEIAIFSPIPTLKWDGPLSQKMNYAIIEKRELFSDHDLLSLHFESTEEHVSFAGRFIRGLAVRIFGQPDLSSKSLVEFTIDGYNLLADRDVEVEKKTDEEGNVVAFNIRGGNLSFFRGFSGPKESE